MRSELDPRDPTHQASSILETAGSKSFVHLLCKAIWMDNELVECVELFTLKCIIHMP